MPFLVNIIMVEQYTPQTTVSASKGESDIKNFITSPKFQSSLELERNETFVFIPPNIENT